MKISLFKAVFLLVMAIGLAGFIIGAFNGEGIGNDHDAWRACETYIVQQIGSPTAHNFPYQRDTVIEHFDNVGYWVRLVTTDTATSQAYLWSCSVIYMGNQYKLSRLLSNPVLH